MCNYMTKAEYKELKEVPDPYFGGAEGFEKVDPHAGKVSLFGTAKCCCVSLEESLFWTPCHEFLSRTLVMVRVMIATQDRKLALPALCVVVH